MHDSGPTTAKSTDGRPRTAVSKKTDSTGNKASSRVLKQARIKENRFNSKYAQVAGSEETPTQAYHLS
jgi:hypothetical protein